MMETDSQISYGRQAGAIRKAGWVDDDDDDNDDCDDGDDDDDDDDDNDNMAPCRFPNPS